MSYNIDIATTEGIPNGMEEENRSDVTEVARIIVDTDMTRTKNDGRVVLLPGAVTDRELRIDIGKTVHHDPPTRERKAIITPAGTMEEVGIPMLVLHTLITTGRHIHPPLLLTTSHMVLVPFPTGISQPISHCLIISKDFTSQHVQILPAQRRYSTSGRSLCVNGIQVD